MMLVAPPYTCANRLRQSACMHNDNMIEGPLIKSTHVGTI
jgi:hypothetical protein